MYYFQTIATCTNQILLSLKNQSIDISIWEHFIGNTLIDNVS